MTGAVSKLIRGIHRRWEKNFHEDFWAESDLSLSLDRRASLLVIGVLSFIIFSAHTFLLLSEVLGDGLPLGGRAQEIFWVVVVFILCFSALNFRRAILISLAATPVFHIPAVPHFFTQGAGDLFAVVAVASFLVRWGASRAFNLGGIGIVFFAIPTAALISIFFNIFPIGDVSVERIKLQIAELAGLILAVSYSFVLFLSLRSVRDFHLAAGAVLIALVGVGLQAFISLMLVSYCVSDLVGTQMSSAGQVSAGFGNPNYFASWVLVAILVPAAKLCALPQLKIEAFFFASMIFILAVLLCFSVSRSALLGLVVVLAACAYLSKSQGVRWFFLASLFLVVIFFPAAWNFRFQACGYTDGSRVVDFIIQNNTVVNILNGLGLDFYFYKGEAPIVSDPFGDDYHPSRLELIVVAFQAWLSSPVFGIGPGQLAAYTQLQLGSAERAHSILLTVAAEQGIIGFLVWISFWLFLIYKVSCVYYSPRAVGDVRLAAGFVFVSLMSVTISSLFADQFRAIWLWQVVGCLLAFCDYFFSDRRNTS